MNMRALVTLSLAATSLGAAGTYREDVARTDIVALGRRPAYQSVLRVTSDGGGSGSAVLVAPQWALSAAHIFSNLDSASYRIEVDSNIVAIDSVILHPAFHSARDSSFVDLALVHLARPMPRIKPSAITWSRLSMEQRIVSIGYGRISAARETEASPPGTRHGFENILDTALTGNEPRSYVGADLDSPDDPSFSTSGGTKALPLEGINNGGDSGGGLFVRTSRGWRLAGIVASTRHSRERLEQFAKYGWYGSVSFWTRLDAQRQWIRSHVPSAR